MHQSKPKQKNKKPSASSGVVRIIGGSMRGRKIRFSGAQGLRPTLDRVRETLFNWLARDIASSHCLDLYAGSGALSFEALSRSAESVTLVEKNRKVAEALKANCKQLQIENAKVINLEAEKFLATNEKKFDLVFLDPPFGKGMLEKITDMLLPHLNDEALVYIEQEKNQDEFIPAAPLAQLKHKSTGNFSYALYQYRIDE